MVVQFAELQVDALNGVIQRRDRVLVGNGMMIVVSGIEGPGRSEEVLGRHAGGAYRKHTDVRDKTTLLEPWVEPAKACDTCLEAVL